MLNNWPHVIRYLCLQSLMVRCFMYDFSIWQWYVFAYMCTVYTHLRVCVQFVVSVGMYSPRRKAALNTLPLSRGTCFSAWRQNDGRRRDGWCVMKTNLHKLTRTFHIGTFSVIFKQDRLYKSNSLADSKWDLQLLLWADFGPRLAVTTCLSLC